MDKPEKIVTFRADTCTYNLVYPDFFLTVPKANLVKLFKWLFRYDWYRENEEAIDFFDRALPELKELVEARSKEKMAAAEKKLSERMTDYEREYRDPSMSKLPADWSKDKKKSERDRRKEFNRKYMERVKDAKTALRWAEKQAQKDLERVKEVCAIYQDAKNN